MITQKKRVKEVRLPIKNADARIVIDGSKAWLKKNDSWIPFHSDSGMLILLIENHNRDVTHSQMKKTKGANTHDRIVPNTISKIRDRLRDAGMRESDLQQLIITHNSGTAYRASMVLSEDDIIYDEDFTMDPFLPFPISEDSGYAFPSLDILTGGQQIRTDYLPQCILNNEKYSRLQSCFTAAVQSSRRNSAAPVSMILSGAGGSGKTFSMLHLYGEAEHLGIRPVYVRMPDLEDKEHNLLHFISRKYLQEQDYDRHVSAFENFMNDIKTPVLFLIDGMNEVSTRKQEHCCRSFKWMAETYPMQISGIFSTRFPQWLRSMLYHPLEVQLLPLDVHFLRDKKQAVLSRLHMNLTPLILDLMDRMDPAQLKNIHSRYDLYLKYFDHLADRACQKNGDGWIYDVLAYTAAKSMEGETINNRWLKTLCSDQGEYDFIHSWCAGEEYPLEDPSAVEKLKATGFLTKGFGDVYTIHQQYRDCLTVRYALLMIRCGALNPAEFLAKLIDATRYFTVSGEEDQAYVNFRRHNNMDLGEFGFYAGLSWYHEHGKPDALVPLLIQLGVQVAYLYDNVRNLEGLYDLHCHLDGLLARCLELKAGDARMNTCLPGYYFCLNKLVSSKNNIKNLSSLKQRLALSEKLEMYYNAWKEKGLHDSKHCAVAYSGLGGVYLARFHILPDFGSRHEALSHAIEYHTRAMELRRSNGSPKLYLSCTALGTDYFHKGILYLSAEDTDLTQEAANVFREAANQHYQAVQQEKNPEMYISWARMAGCWYQLYQLTSPSKVEELEECRRNLAAAVASSYNCISSCASKGGVIHLSSEIHALLRDISLYLPLLPLTEADIFHIDNLCSLYHQAFPDKPEPRRSPDNRSILF